MNTGQSVKNPRTYSQTTIKALFAFSGNCCAYPGCRNALVAPETDLSAPAVLGQICHIYATKDRGPRGKPDLNAKERNASSNLILLCGVHHPLVDSQHRDYPADTLIRWKRTHEAKHQRGSPEADRAEIVRRQAVFLAKTFDAELHRQYERLRSSRVFEVFDGKGEASRLVALARDGELSGGSRPLRAKVIALCARIISTVDFARASELVGFAKMLDASDDVRLAEAALLGASERNQGLAALSEISTPAAKSAALRVVRNHDKATGALRWVQQTAITLDHLDAEGRFFLILTKLECTEWGPALADAQALSNEDFEAFPALYHIAALAHLTSTLVEPLRSVAMKQLPLDLGSSALGSDPDTMALRRAAARLFEKADAALRGLGLVSVADVNADYALWLDVNDPARRQQALETIRTSMRDPRRAIKRVQFAIYFGVEFDRPRVEDLIETSLAMSGSGNVEIAYARFCLTMSLDEPSQLAAAFEKNRELFHAYLNSDAVRFGEIDVLVRAGMPGLAQGKLDQAISEGLDAATAERLRIAISSADVDERIVGFRRRYDASGELVDLAHLVDALEEQRSWPELLPFSQRLFEETKSHVDGARLVKIYDELDQPDRLLQHLDANPHLLASSPGLRTFEAWSLFKVGRLKEAALRLRDLASSRDDENDRALRVNIAIASGDWSDIASFANEQWVQRDSRPANEQLTAGSLASAMGTPHARDLVCAAVEKAPDDPAILVAAYHLAVSGGWEDETTSDWLVRAGDLSGADGPVQKMALQDLVHMQPEWATRETSAWNMLREGAIPQFSAARLLGRSLSDLMLSAALANLGEKDVRRQSIVHAFSGARSWQKASPMRTLALDVTALLTLGFLRLLKPVIDTYESVVISRKTLAWLFEKRRSTSFHQPSRIRHAKAVHELIVSGALKVLHDRPLRDHRLAEEIGTDLADLLAVAKTRTEGTPPRCVIRAAPVYRLGSMMLEEADLSDYQDVLCSCEAVVDRLRRSGALSAGEERNARAYLRLQERPWPAERPIEDRAEIYLDDLSVHWLQGAGILKKLANSGLSVFVTRSLELEANGFIGIETRAEDQREIMDLIRSSLANGLQSEKIKLSSAKTGSARAFADHPTHDVLALSEDADVIIVDDRFLNRHDHVENDGHIVPLATTLDVIADLFDRGLISVDEKFEHRARLRGAGYQLIPFDADEIQHFLRNAPAEDDGFSETAELRAIDRAILRARMSRLLQLPTEGPWLQQSLRASRDALHSVWQTEDIPRAQAMSRWLLYVFDARGWAPCALDELKPAFAFNLHSTQLLSILMPPAAVDSKRRDAYLDWVDAEVLADVEDRQPEMYAWLVAQSRELVLAAPGFLSPDLPASAAARVRAGLLPRRLRVAVASDPSVTEAVGISVDATMTFPGDLSFQRSAVLEVLGLADLSAGEAVNVADMQGAMWEVSLVQKEGIPAVVIARDDVRFLSPRLAFALDDRSKRQAAFSFAADAVGLPKEATAKWSDHLIAERLSGEASCLLEEDLEDTPTAVFERILQALQTGRCDARTLLPKSARYLERLIGACDDDSDLLTFIAIHALPHMQALLAWRPREGAMLSFLSCAHPLLISTLDGLMPAGCEIELLNELSETGDLLSQVAALELCLRANQGSEALRRALNRLALRVFGDQDAFGRRCERLAMLTVFIFGSMSDARLLADKPPFWRRLASLAHASLIERCLNLASVDGEEFAKWLRYAGAGRFLAQSFVDQRREPRSALSLLSGRQLVNEFGARILSAAQNAPEGLNEIGLEELLGDDGQLAGNVDPILGALPGPLESGLTPMLVLPDSKVEALRSALLSQVPFDALLELSHLALLCAVPQELAEAAADSIRQNASRLLTEERKEFNATLLGLSHLAATTRSRSLCDALRALLYRYHFVRPEEISRSLMLQISLQGVAAHSSVTEWASAVGDVFENMAFAPDLGDDAELMFHRLSELIHVAPALWPTCGHAHAALSAMRTT